jgi:hypothetical protein
MNMPTDQYTDEDWRQIAWELRRGIHHYSENLNTAATDNWSAYLLDQLEKDMVNQADALQPLIDSIRKQGSQWEASYVYARERLLDAHSKVLALQNASDEQERQSLAEGANEFIFQAMGVLPE